MISYYTANYRNLGSNSSQRTESVHPIIKAVLNPQLPLETSVKSMQTELKLWYRKIREDIACSRVDRPRTVDTMAFSVLIGRVTL